MKAYIASGWFNKYQAEDLEDIKDALQAYGIKFFSPKDECLCPPDASPQRKMIVFRMNLAAISDCDFIVCNTRDKDMGSVFEAGYASALKKPIIYFCKGLKGDFNLMLAESGAAVATNISQLSYILGRLKMNINWTETYNGGIQ